MISRLSAVTLRQLTKLPTNAGRKFARACVDSPSEADIYEAKLRDGDIVIAYVCFLWPNRGIPFLKSILQTDGFSDNVFPSEMVTICSLVARGGRTEDEQVQDMADRMVEYSRLCMKSKTRVSPFESMSFFPLPPDIPNPHFLFSGEASREGMYFRGGVRCLIFLLIYRLLMLFL